MLLSWQPVLGRGTSKSVQQPLEVQNAAQRLNLSLGLYNHHPFKATCQGGTIPKCKIHFLGPPLNQWEFQNPKMEVLYIRPYFMGMFPYIGLT
jgi:hypothetical protein